MNEFEKYFKKGLLKKQRPVFSQIERQIVRARRDIRTSRKVIDIDPEWAVTIAYQAMLRAGRALLFAKGYLPADGAQHKTVVDLTANIMGDQFKRLTLQFNKLRKQRNLFFYESEDTNNMEEAADAIKTAEELIREISTVISSDNPQLLLSKI